eukprot:1224098-Pleurochrysis_carterae.AAC.1
MKLLVLSCMPKVACSKSSPLSIRFSVSKGHCTERAWSKSSVVDRRDRDTPGANSRFLTHCYLWLQLAALPGDADAYTATKSFA